jgi:hypothetical protein
VIIIEEFIYDPLDEYRREIVDEIVNRKLSSNFGTDYTTGKFFREHEFLEIVDSCGFKLHKKIHSDSWRWLFPSDILILSKK